MHIMLTESHLSQIMRNASQRKRQQYIGPLNAAMAAHDIDTLLRAAAFVAQLAHESGEFQFMEEIWGPTAAQRRYEPPSELARKIGNTKTGDGKRFKGRGPIQITGRSNYTNYGKLLGINLADEPERAATPEVGFATAGLFWQRNGLNELADAGDFKGITKRINGGQNGEKSRELFFERAKLVLVSAFPAQARRVKKPSAHALAPLGRGFEEIQSALSNTVPRPSKKRSGGPQKDARADTLDFRDLMYTPALIEVPTHIPLGDYLDYNVPILDQGNEGACTGFGLATVANYLLLRRRVIPDNVPVSARMLYQLARRYDEWPGEDYSGSSARGAMKGWHKHGVSSAKLYPNQQRNGDSGLTVVRTSDAKRRPLGAYFRVNHKDLVAMHSAIAEVGVLYATCTVHDGWDRVSSDGLIDREPTDHVTGGHAFAIVAYDDQGFWLQNSWGPNWGRAGFARISYDDWLENGTDVWVARLGAPVTLRSKESTATAHASTAGESASYAYADLRPHIVSVGNNGKLRAGGDYGITPAELQQIFEKDVPRVTKSWAKTRILLYAHGGLVSERNAAQRLAEYRPALLDGHVYPLAFIWRSDYWTTITNILQDAVRRRRPEGVLDAAKDFMLDRLDDALEPLARALTGKSAWDEMKENAIAASNGDGAAVLVADHLKELSTKVGNLEIHMVGHSAGSILHAPIVKLLTDRGLAIETCTLWAPACTVELFKESYVPAMRSGTLKRMTVFALRDKTERDDNCAGIYNKSLLYLVSGAFEKTARIPVFRDVGVPILGMERSFSKDPDLRNIFAESNADLVYTPNDEPMGSLKASEAKHHGDFDDDDKTVAATFGRITSASTATAPLGGQARAKAEPSMNEALTKERAGTSDASIFQRSGSSLRDRRLQIDAKTQPNRWQRD
jgi:predicted chitinase